MIYSSHHMYMILVILMMKSSLDQDFHDITDNSTAVYLDRKYLNIYSYLACFCKPDHECPDNKVHGANMGPTWVLSAPDGPHIGPVNLAIRVCISSNMFVPPGSASPKQTQSCIKNNQFIEKWSPVQVSQYPNCWDCLLDQPTWNKNIKPIRTSQIISIYTLAGGGFFRSFNS